LILVSIAVRWASSQREAALAKPVKATQNAEAIMRDLIMVFLL
jgi:hypothetical protein